MSSRHHPEPRHSDERWPLLFFAALCLASREVRIGYWLSAETEGIQKWERACLKPRHSTVDMYSNITPTTAQFPYSLLTVNCENTYAEARQKTWIPLPPIFGKGKYMLNNLEIPGYGKWVASMRRTNHSLSFNDTNANLGPWGTSHGAPVFGIFMIHPSNIIFMY